MDHGLSIGADESEKPNPKRKEHDFAYAMLIGHQKGKILTGHGTALGLIAPFWAD
jgi:hypothetical protein